MVTETSPTKQEQHPVTGGDNSAEQSPPGWAARLQWLLAVLLLLIIGMFIVVFTVHHNFIREIEYRSHETLESTAKQTAVKIAGLVTDLAYLTQNVMTETGTDSAELDSEHNAQHLINYLKAKPYFFQARILDKNGMEVLRCEHDTTGVRLAAPDELQDKHLRYYFKDVSTLPAGAVYLSELDLNMEHGIIERPLRPTLRLASPLFSDNEFAGCVVLNFSAQQLIDNAAAVPGPASSLWINSSGGFIIGADAGDDWSFQLAEESGQEPVTFATRFPQAWEQIQTSQNGTTRTHDGLFMHRQLNTEMIQQETARLLGAKGVVPGIHCDTNCWFVAYLPAGLLAKLEVRQTALPLIALVLLISAIFPVGYIISIANRRRRAAEEQLTSSERLYRTLADHSTDMISRHKLDGTYTYVSPVCQTMTGYEPTELIGTNAYDYFHAPDLGEITRSHQGIVTKMDTQIAAYRFRHKDGGLPWLETTSRVIRNETTGEPVEIICITRNIDQRKQVEEELLESRRKLDAAQRIAQLGSWNWNMATDEVEWSDETYRIFGLTPKSIQPNMDTIFEMIKPADIPNVQQAIQEALEKTNKYACDFRIQLPSGKLKYAQTQGEVFRNASGKPMQMIGTILDITNIKEVEQELRRSQASLLQAQRIAKLGFWEWDVVRNEVVVSDVLYELTGTIPGQLDSLEAFINYVHPEDRDMVFAEIQSSIESGTDYVIEYRVRHADGTILHLKAHGEVETDAAGKVQKMFGIAEDITAAKVAESLIKESEEKFRQVAENLTQVVWLRTPEEMLYINPAFETVWGVSRRALYDDPSIFLQSIHPDDRQQIEGMFMSRDYAESGYFDAEYRIIKPGGDVRWIRARSFPVRKDGVLVRTVGIADDVTETKAREQEVKYSEERFRTLSQASTEGIVIHQGGTAVAINNRMCEMSGYTREELEGKSMLFIIAPEELDNVRQHFAEDESSYESIIVAKSGERIPVRVTARRTNYQGEPARVAVLTDLTQQRLAEAAQRREAELEMLRKAAATYAHEINNPLTGITGIMQMLEMELSDEEQRAMLKDGLNAAKRIKEMIDAMLKLEDPQFRPYVGGREIIDIRGNGDDAGEPSA